MAKGKAKAIELRLRSQAEIEGEAAVLRQQLREAKGNHLAEDRITQRGIALAWVLGHPEIKRLSFTETELATMEGLY
jgi:hypothetical protein